MTFLRKLFILEDKDAINDLKRENKENVDLSDFRLECQRKQLRENIFYQNLFFVSIVNHFTVAHYSFKNYRSHLIFFARILFNGFK